MELLNNIKKKEENLNMIQREKFEKKEKMQEESYHQRLEKESRLKEIFREQENRREEIRQWLDDKNEKVEEYFKQKEKLNKSRRLLTDQINRKKTEYSAKFAEIFHKKNIDKATLKKIKDMFPNNKQINSLIEEYNDLNKKENKKEKIKKIKYSISAKNIIDKSENKKYKNKSSSDIRMMKK
jgi:hypothetical protein